MKICLHKMKFFFIFWEPELGKIIWLKTSFDNIPVQHIHAHHLSYVSSYLTISLYLAHSFAMSHYRLPSLTEPLTLSLLLTHPLRRSLFLIHLTHIYTMTVLTYYEILFSINLSTLLTIEFYRSRSKMSDFLTTFSSRLLVFLQKTLKFQLISPKKLRRP